MAAGLLMAGALLVCPVCAVMADDEVQPVTITLEQDYLREWGEDAGKYLCEFSYPGVHVTKEQQSLYPELADALEKVSSDMAAEEKAYYEECLESARTDAADHPEYFMTHTDTHHFLLQRADSRAVSFVETLESYTGGVHGYHGYQSYNFDSKDGRKLNLSDAVSDVGAFIGLVDEALNSKYPDLDPEWRADLLTEENAENLVWTLGNAGMTVWFGNYEIASYAEGMQNVTVPFAGNEAVFSDMYRASLADYAFAFPAWETASVDTDGDGTMENVQFWADRDEYSYDRLYVNIDGTETGVDLWCYEFDGTYVIKDGKAYLYIFGTSDNDYGILMVFDLSRKTAVLVSSEGLSRHYERLPEDRYGVQQLTNPLDFVLDIRTDLLSTLTAGAHFYTGEEGKPEMYEAWYTFIWPRELTAKQDFMALAVDENGTEGEDVLITAGTTLALYRTDDSGWVDARTSDRDLVRMYVNADSWPRLVDGKDIEELFDGVMFAG